MEKEVKQHDPLCPNKPCTCNYDDYGHQFDCTGYCNCNMIAKVREDERERIVAYVASLKCDPDHNETNPETCVARNMGIEQAALSICAYYKIGTKNEV